MKKTIAQAQKTINQLLGTAQTAYDAAFARNPHSASTLALEKEKNALCAIKTMLDSMGANPRLERVFLKDLDKLDEAQVSQMCSYTQTDPNANSLRMKSLVFRDDVIAVRNSIRARHHFIALHTASRNMLHLLNSLQNIVNKIQLAHTEYANLQRIYQTAQQELNNDTQISPQRRQQLNADNSVRLLRIFRNLLYIALEDFFAIKAEIDVYRILHPGYEEQNLEKLEQSLYTLLESMCEGPRSLIMGNDHEKSQNRIYTIKEIYEYILTTLPNFNPDTQRSLREVLTIFNALILFRYEKNMSFESLYNNTQQTLANYAQTHCDGKLLIPLCQSQDFNAGTTAGLCLGYAKNCIHQLAAEVGFFHLVSKHDHFLSFKDAAYDVNFYQSSIKEVQLQNHRDKYRLFSGLSTSHKTLNDYMNKSVKENNTPIPPVYDVLFARHAYEMELQLKDLFAQKSEFFSRLSFWEKGESVGHTVALCHRKTSLGSEIYLLDSEVGFLKFTTAEGFLKFFSKYAEKCMPTPAKIAKVVLLLYDTRVLREQAAQRAKEANHAAASASTHSASSPASYSDSSASYMASHFTTPSTLSSATATPFLTRRKSLSDLDHQSRPSFIVAKGKKPALQPDNQMHALVSTRLERRNSSSF